MPEKFQYDVFLSHSSKDKAVVRPLAERLRADGLKVWFDEWEIKPGDSIPARIEAGLEHSRVLVLCMSADAFGSDWAQLEAGTFRFRDPLNKERRFIPLRLDDAPIKGSLAQFLYINWRPADGEQEYGKLFESCRPTEQAAHGPPAEEILYLRYRTKINAYAFSLDGRRAITGAGDHTARIWELSTERCLGIFKGDENNVTSVALSSDQRRVFSGDARGSVYLWDAETGRRLQVFKGHTDIVWSLELNSEENRVLSCSWDQSVRLWDAQTGDCLRVIKDHKANVQSRLQNSDFVRNI